MDNLKEANTYSNLGILHTRLQEDNKAIDYLQKAIQLNPNHMIALRQLSDLYLRNNYFNEAVVILKQLIPLQNDIEINYRLGIAFYYLKQNNHALHEFQYVYQQNKKYEDVNQYLANLFLEQGAHQVALQYYHQQISVSPMAAAYYNIGFILMMQNKYQDALTYLFHAEKLDSTDSAIPLNIANIYLKQKKMPEAIAYYQRAQMIKPDDPEIQHILSALMQDKKPDSAPTVFLQNLFDQYANYYDKHLNTCLQYTAPEQLLKAVETDANTDMSVWTVVDLGCGTGLTGALFKPLVKKLIGIDISEKMLAVAEFKGIYDELILGDIESILPALSAIHCIIAADVLTYFGNLESLFSKIRDTLLPDGIFSFTVEKTTQADYLLQTSIRYAHHEKYINSLSAQYHFDLLRLDSIVMRKDQNKPIEGYLIVLKKRREN